MKISSVISTVIILGVLSFFMFAGYDKYYGIYWKSDVNNDEIESYTYLYENFPVTVNSANINRDQNGYFIDFNVTIQNKSSEFLNSIIIIPNISLETGTNENDIGYQTVGLKQTEILYGKILDAGKKITLSRKLYFTDNNSYEGFNQDKLRYKIQKATFTIGIDGENSTGYKISNEANINYSHAKIDITSEWENIRLK